MRSLVRLRPPRASAADRACADQSACVLPARHDSRASRAAELPQTLSMIIHRSLPGTKVSMIDDQ